MTAIEHYPEVDNLNTISFCGIGLLGGVQFASFLHRYLCPMNPPLFISLESALIFPLTLTLPIIVDCLRASNRSPSLCLMQFATISFCLGYWGRSFYDLTLEAIKIFQSVRKAWSV